jgi:hypothetical protein
VSSTSLDQPFTQAGLAAQPAFEPSHPAVIALVIIAKKVQKTMQSQDADLGSEGVPRLAGLSARHTRRNHHIAQIPRFFGRK